MNRTEMNPTASILLIAAHPDDETLGFGGTIAMYARRGVATYVVTATDGQQGWFGEQEQYPGADRLGQIRIRELNRATRLLGACSVTSLGYMDGELARAPRLELIETLAAQIRRLRPEVVLTFGPDGMYGHPDHVAISQATTAAVVQAAATGGSGGPAHQVQKLYYRAPSADYMARYEQAFGCLEMEIDGETRGSDALPDWRISATLDTSEVWEQVKTAALRHQSQVPANLAALSDEQHRALWGVQEYQLAMSLVESGEREEDLLEGIACPLQEFIAA